MIFTSGARGRAETVAPVNPILSASRISDWEDPWGTALGWGFPCCAVLEYMGEPIPSKYGYHASMAGAGSDLADGSYESAEVVELLGLGAVNSDGNEPVVTLFELEDIPDDVWERAAEYAAHAAEVFHLICTVVPESDRY